MKEYAIPEAMMRDARGELALSCGLTTQDAADSCFSTANGQTKAPGHD